jgi:ferrochelatase
VERVGLLLVNLGTPAAPNARDVRRYLREFLSDPRVLDIPAWKRFLLLELLILPTRPKASAAAYRKIWTAEGSPLLVHARALAGKLRERLGGALEVELAMRYGKPSIAHALDRLERAGVSRIVLFPLFPHWSAAATGSAVARVYELAARRWNTPGLQTIPPFYAHSAYLDARAEVARPILAEAQPEVVFMTAHGLPERQIRRSDPSGGYCLVRDGCCDAIGDANRSCYRAHCFEAARRLGDRLGLPRAKVIVCFQSRLGRTPWLRPYTDEVLAAEARRGAKNAVILSTGFVADCLETLEELGMRGVETWQENGGERLALVPALNASDRWVDAIVAIAREGSSWFAEASDGARS